MTKIKRLKLDPSTKEVVDKINELVDFINKIEAEVYATPPPRPYDTNALNRFRRK